MSAKPITKSQAKLESWGEIRALDRLAVPLIREHGIVEAYRLVVGWTEPAIGNVAAGANKVRS